MKNCEEQPMSVSNFITYNIEAVKISSTSVWRHCLLNNPHREKQPFSHVTLVALVARVGEEARRPRLWPRGSEVDPSKGNFGTRTNWCVLNKELCTSDCFFLWGCVQNNLSKPCSVPRLLFCEVDKKTRFEEILDVMCQLCFSCKVIQWISWRFDVRSVCSELQWDAVYVRMCNQ